MLHNISSQVYTEPLCRRHYSSLFGEAVICRLSILAISIAMSLVVSYSTGGFWVKLKPDITQASVHYTYDAILVFEVSWCHAPLVIPFHSIEHATSQLLPHSVDCLCYPAVCTTTILTLFSISR